MEGLLTDGTSIYHRLVALYTRRHDGSLTNCSNGLLQENWSCFPSLQEVSSTASSRLTRHVQLPSAVLNSQDSSTVSVQSVSCLVLERNHTDGQLISGIIVRADVFGNHDDLDEYFMDLILRSTQRLSIPKNKTSFDSAEETIEKIVDLFDSTLRNITPDDRWKASGRQYFSQHIKHFVDCGMRIEFALPAFPCKSSNPNKVCGNLPDRGEMIALTTLHEFVMDIEQLYAPGATVLIVSDGHVFSDCIGVDDGMVDLYSKHLRNMNDSLSKTFHDNGRKRVRFQSLTEMLQLDGNNVQGAALARCLGLASIPHHISHVQINDDAELCRRY